MHRLGYKALILICLAALAYAPPMARSAGAGPLAHNREAKPMAVTITMLYNNMP